MAEIEIISAQVCPFAQRTRMVLLEKGLDFDLTEIDLENKPDWFAEVSPYSKVPVLRRGEERIYESAIINEYIEEIYPEPRLMPADAARRAQARIWIDYCDHQFIPTYYKLLLSQDLEKRAELRDKLLGQLLFMEREGMARLSEAGPFWLGQDVSLVDFAYYPFFERFVVAEHYRDVEIPGECERLRRWQSVMAERESARSTGNSRDYYIEKYVKYTDGDADGVTAREMKAS